ncbi:FadR/GntR family transcriptional regulator [Amycolatopsis sp. BJA-103]|uniref:FadR/GntR family transcriptional regulator n=1 Tax=Amycolatopsis sp. BJA-103 TaxID=1911175 RepID=UPI000C75D611|nr:FadR/GntR family transcriptional regulator [Amycolatopsis sp. BJA-103]AUI62730.1 GntR family transcriptional regulator [Amycolatopsis sp. BJA-103]PNE18570.1 GntR family transcriptional regulator [Amycolatopsis sp. BJA-103]
MEFEPVAPVRAYQRVVEQIEEAVFSGRIKPGDRLPSERELMVQFDVGRSTVREALRVLQAAEMIRSRPGDPRGPEVLAASPAVLHRSMHRLARADHLGLSELLQFRMILDGSAHLLAAQLRTEDHLAELGTALEAMRAGVTKGFAEFGHADVAFHEAIARATGNPLLVISGEVVRGVVLELIEDKLEHADDRTALMRNWLAHHEEVLEAIRDSDGERASRLAKQALYDNYAEYVPEEQRRLLQPLLS